MKIGIIGGGSLGLLFAYYLSHSFSVTIYTRTLKQAEMINQEGVRLKNKEHTLTATVSALPFHNWKGLDELTIVTVKQYQLFPILEEIKNQSSSCPRLLFLQNGMGHLKQLKNIHNCEIYVGSVEHGAYRDNSNTVYHNGEGITRIADFKGNKVFLEKFVQSIPSNFPFVIEPDYYQMLVKKLVVNALINPLTAVLKVQNGELVKNPHYYKIIKSLFLEIMTILELNDQDQYFAHVVNVCEKTSTNRSSMLKDIDHQRETEIDAILGFLLEEAEVKGLDTPNVYTFYHIIKGLTMYKWEK